jgi:hypothetical protein
MTSGDRRSPFLCVRFVSAGGRWPVGRKEMFWGRTVAGCGPGGRRFESRRSPSDAGLLRSVGSRTTTWRVPDVSRNLRDLQCPRDRPALPVSSISLARAPGCSALVRRLSTAPKVRVRILSGALKKPPHATGVSYDAARTGCTYFLPTFLRKRQRKAVQSRAISPSWIRAVSKAVLADLLGDVVYGPRGDPFVSIARPCACCSSGSSRGGRSPGHRRSGLLPDAGLHGRPAPPCPLVSRAPAAASQPGAGCGNVVATWQAAMT